MCIRDRVLVWIGVPIYGSILVSMEEWWARVGVFSLVYSVIEIVGAGLGGQIGVMLRDKLAGEKPREKANEVQE